MSEPFKIVVMCSTCKKSVSDATVCGCHAFHCNKDKCIEAHRDHGKSDEKMSSMANKLMQKMRGMSREDLENMSTRLDMDEADPSADPDELQALRIEVEDDEDS